VKGNVPSALNADWAVETPQIVFAVCGERTQRSGEGRYRGRSVAAQRRRRPHLEYRRRLATVRASLSNRRLLTPTWVVDSRPHVDPRKVALSSLCRRTTVRRT